MSRPSSIDRRVALSRLGAIFAALPVARTLSGCGGTNTTGAAATDAGATAADSGTSMATEAGATATETGVADAASGWASGGTASMTAKASYPNPFSSALSSCSATAALTEGPCYDSAAATISDISYGQLGLPVRLMLQIVDASCKPVAGATVSVWHCDALGVYSGDDTVNMQVDFCTGGDAAHKAALWFRGVQTTDANGVVTFDTCFPGWYSSRTIHIHFTATSGSTSLTSQLVFDDALDDEIISTQPVYSTRPKRDTTNLTDTVVNSSNYKEHLLQYEKMTDGAMLAYTTITIS